MGSLLSDQKLRLEKACKNLKVEDDIYTYFSHPLRSTTVTFPVRRDAGHFDFIQGYRVQHSTTLGPTKGGLIISDQYTLEDIQGLAMIMTYKAALVGIPLGGSCGVIVADPNKYNKNEIERMVRRYTSSIINVIGPLQDIIGPDLNTDATIMTWIADTYSMSVGHTVHRVCTGKSVEVGGIIGRDQGVGVGISYILHELARTEFEEIQNHRVIIQGLGHIGRNFMEAADKMGARIIAVSDSKGGIFNLEGLDVSAVIAYKREHGHISDFPEAQNISNEEMLTLECDVLIPCAVPGQITADIAKRVQCRRIIEGANAAITQEADRILWDRIILVIPDILANAGGMIVSYFEWAQNFTNHAWELEEVHRELKKIIVRTFHEVNDLRICEDVTFREASYMIAVKRLADAHGWRGIYP